MNLDHFDHENMDKSRINGYDAADEPIININMPLPKRSIPTDSLLNEVSIFFTEQSHQQQQQPQQQQPQQQQFDDNVPDTFSGNYLSSMLAGGGMISSESTPGGGGMHETFRSASTPLMSGSGVSGSNIAMLSLQQQHDAMLDRGHNDHNNHNSFINFEYNNNNDNNNHIANDNIMGRGNLINRSQSASLSDYHTQHRQSSSGPSNLQAHLADVDRRMLDIRRGKPASPPLSQPQYPTGGQHTNGMMAANMMAANMMNSNGQGLDGNVLMQHLQLQQQQQLLMRRPGSTQSVGNGGNGTMTFNAQMQQQQRMLGLMANSTNSMAHHQQQGSQMRSASTPLPFPMHQSMDAMHMHHHPGNGGSSKSANQLASALNLCGLEDSSVEDIVAKSCRDILVEAASHSLKAVELANTLRARVGTEVLAHIRERWGGLLSLLERHSHVFRVERIPKNDLVTLVNPSAGLGGSSSMMMMMGSSSEREVLGLSMRGFTTSPNSALGGQQQGVFHDRRSPPIHSSTSPGLLNGGGGGDNYSVSSMGSSSFAGYSSHMLGNAGAFEREGAVSRCLHVGNVPSNMAESQLLRELERYGDVDCLKLGEFMCASMQLTSLSSTSF